MPLSAESFQAHAYLYKAFYLAGLFKAIFDKIEKDHVTAVEAAKAIQIDSTNLEFDHWFSYPTTRDISFYEEGERILSAIDPDVSIPPSIMKRMKSGHYKYGMK